MPKLTLEQFGQSIKAKHPEYKDMDNTALAEAVLAKYPQYSDMVDQATETPSTLQKIETGAGNLAKGIGKSGVSLISTGDEWARQHLPAFLTNTKMGFGPPANLEHVKEMATPDPNSPMQKLGYGAGEAAQFLIPGGLEERIAAGAPGLLAPALKIGASALSSGLVNKAQGGSATTGALMGAGGSAVGEGLKAAAPVAQRAGLALGNTALGALSPKLFKYGAEPARGAYEEGILPALSKSSAARKLEAALPRVGERISQGVEAGSPVPLSDISQSIESPIRSAKSIIEGPGGANRSSEPLNALQESMTRRAPGASQPIYGAGAGRPFSPGEAHAAITSRGPLLLGAGSEEIPLAPTPGVEGTLSRPITLNAPERPMRLGLPSPSAEVPMAPGMQEEFPERLPSGTSSVRLNPPTGEAEGMGPGQYIGGISGERGGPGQVQGVLRRPMTFGESPESSPLLDLRHPEATAPDVWHTIRNIDANTRFNPDPEVEGLNEVRRSIRGGLRGNLVEAAPGISAPSQTYSDLMGAQQGLDRSMHGGTSVGKLLSVPAFPLESTVGRLLYGAPKIVPAINRGVLPAATGAALQLTNRGNQ